MAKINQADNYAANFGICQRSSAIFWIPAVSQGSVCFALANYWMFKNGAKVLLVASYRNMAGKLIARHRVDFDGSDVLILTPPQDAELERGGSVELEALASEDIRIPYAAIMAIYETDHSISMVHSYARSYSPWEIEENRTISEGHEGCWTLRDTADVYSFAVLHNGAAPQAAHVAKIEAKNCLGKTTVREINIPQLNAFQTLVVKPADHIADLVSFLDGQPGSATIDFNLNGAFTRLLVGWQSTSTNQLQVTHSNFNYAIHETDKVKGEKQAAYMRVPVTPFQSKAVVYPDFSPGDYEVQPYDHNGIPQNSIQLRSARTALTGSALVFCRVDGSLPSRIVTAVERITTPQEIAIPCECSLGILHSKRPPKHFHWGVCHTGLPSELLIVAYPEIYGNPDHSCSLIIKCMLANGKFIERTINWREIGENHRASLSLNNLIPTLNSNNDAITKSDFCYLTIYSSYGGFSMYTAILKQDSWTLEHTF